MTDSPTKKFLKKKFDSVRRRFTVNVGKKRKEKRREILLPPRNEKGNSITTKITMKFLLPFERPFSI